MLGAWLDPIGYSAPWQTCRLLAKPAVAGDSAAGTSPLGAGSGPHGDAAGMVTAPGPIWPI